VLQTSALARLFGEAAIADAAIVGSDMFLSEGAAIGILFYARNNLIQGSDLTGQRAEALKNNKDASQKQVTIAGRQVPFLSTPDNRIRSYYVADGDYHFVTTSETLARRFLETAKAPGLGKSKEFQHARSVMPLSRNDTIFIYLSDATFRNIVRPAYRVETVRRLQAAADIELVQLAQLAAAVEGKPGDTIEQLIAGRYLPADFGPRPDGSRTVIGPNDVYDSLRGARGTFTPVADVPLKLQELKERYVAEGGRVSHLDGISIDFDDWHFNVRPSNTEPLLRLNLEALSESLMVEKRDEVLALIRA
jgi:hypothetical protein